MPSGYTAPVMEGKITTLAEFAMCCARAFGACISMRDDDSNAPIPERFEPDTKYHDAAISAALAAIGEIEVLSLDECAQRAADEFRIETERRAQRKTERAQVRARYEAMLKQLGAWSPPSDIAELKGFMIKQIVDSMQWDCDERDYSPALVAMTGDQWRQTTLAKLRSDVDYHTAEREKEISRTEDRNKWLATLRASLPKPE